MAETNTHIGLSWGKDCLYVVQVTGAQPQIMFKIPLSREAKLSLERGAYSSGSVDLVTTIEEAFRQNNLGPSTVHLSLPTNDIIFRSFIIPWMQTSEIKGVVEFEVNKYIPFSLNELAFSYHSTTITEEGIKRIRIVFVAIKKQTLDNYTNILEQAGLSVGLVEPASISLMRSLEFKNLIPKDKTIAIVEQGESLGKIIIIDKEIPQFVREFQLKITTATGQEENDSKAIYTRIINEIRISLDYFSRQNTHLDVKEILFLSAAPNLEEAAQKLASDLTLPVKGISDFEILQNAQLRDTRYLMAYGIALAEQMIATAKFELSGKKLTHTKPFFALKRSINIKSTVATVFICLVIITSTVLWGQFSLTRPEEKIAKLKKSLGPYQQSSIVKLKEKKETLNERVTYFDNLRFKSNVAVMLDIIPDLLPKSTWIKTLDISYSDPFGKPKNKKRENKDEKQENIQSKPTINLTGYAYVENANEQFQIVNDLFNNLKTNSTLSGVFQNIDLITVKAETLKEYRVTYYEIKFE